MPLWVRRVLTVEGLVVNKRRAKHNLSLKAFTRVQTAGWTKDDQFFTCPRYRVKTMRILNEFTNTGARPGSFFTNGIRYVDVDLVVQRDNKGGTWTDLQPQAAYVKGNRDPDNVVFGVAGKGHGKLLYNNGGLLLVFALLDNALVGYETLEDVQEQQIPEGDDELILRFKDSVFETPIFRKCTVSGDVINDPMPKDAFISIFRAWIRGAGYTFPASVHAIRRAVGKKIDEHYTEVERSQHLTQKYVRVFGQSYTANTLSADGRAAHLGEFADHRHIDFFQGMDSSTPKAFHVDYRLR